MTTNYDRIKKMSKTEIANWIAKHIQCEQCPCFLNTELDTNDYCDDNRRCIKVIRQWLNQECEE